jgi:hypothetical protein
MKRSFDESDRAIPSQIWDLFPEKKKQLLEIRRLENIALNVWSSYKRKCLALNCQDPIKPKIMRIYIRHEFMPMSTTEKAHYIVKIEGRLLDPKFSTKFPMGLFFDNIRIQIEKKYNPEIAVYEWRKDQFLGGRKAHSFRFKVYAEKPIPIKIFLTRSDFGCKRYELGPTLRDVLPNLRSDPTEEEVMFALWQYIDYNYLLDVSSGRPSVRPDEVQIAYIYFPISFSLSSFPSSLLHLLSPHL